MELGEIILNFNTCQDTDKIIHCVFAKKTNGKFQKNCEAIVLELSPEEMEINLNEISRTKCPEYEYFLEVFIIEEIIEDLNSAIEYETDDKKIERIIYYAENDA